MPLSLSDILRAGLGLPAVTPAADYVFTPPDAVDNFPQIVAGSLAGVMISLIFFFIVGLGVVIGAELNAALAESGATALKGEIYTGPYTDELPVEEPQPGEDVEPVPQKEGPQL